MSRLLIIELAQGLRLEFSLLDTPVTELWLERFEAAQVYPLDHPDRFYGFGSLEQESVRALDQINRCIDKINAHRPVVAKKLQDINDQDTLNYLHNIFERYHGLLDQQTSDFWHTAPEDARRALAELNLSVHRVETVGRGNRPRLVCTWFGLPKNKCLDADLMSRYGTLAPEFGTVCLNYVEIGKTLTDLAWDDDKYIADDAFRPFNFYSADFVIRFYDVLASDVHNNLQRIERYFFRHKDFFQSRGYDQWDDVRLLPLFFPVAKLIETMPRDQLLSAMAQQPCITKVSVQ